LGVDFISLLNTLNSVDLQSSTHSFRAGLLSIGGDWDAIAGLPQDGGALAVSINLQTEFFLNPDAVFSVINALELSELDKTSRLLSHALSSIPWTLLEKLSPNSFRGLANLILNHINGSFINFKLEAESSNVTLHYFVMSQVRTSVNEYIEINGFDQFLDLVKVFAFILIHRQD